MRSFKGPLANVWSSASSTKSFPHLDWVTFLTYESRTGNWVAEAEAKRAINDKQKITLIDFLY